MYSISNIVLEREDCTASLWRKRAYDRLKLHLAKQFCELPHMPFPPKSPKFVPRDGFVKYLDNYESKFEISPRCMKNVESAIHDGERWMVKVKDLGQEGSEEVYLGKYLVVATGENSEGVVPNLPGLEEFNGEIIHSNQYHNGVRFKGKDVLVVGCGNSGMEIAFDLSNHGAKPSIVIRSPVISLHFSIFHAKFHKHACMYTRHLPINIVDSIIVASSKVKFGDLSKYGIERPKLGPFSYKKKTGRTPTIDTGTVRQIKAGKIKVVPEITEITENYVTFANQKTEHFDVIIFATGYKSTVRYWLKV
ncbi:Probable indole-3-pyruvate monooxygenase YUCCA11 [Linum perenne]